MTGAASNLTKQSLESGLTLRELENAINEITLLNNGTIPSISKEEAQKVIIKAAIEHADHLLVSKKAFDPDSYQGTKE